VEKRPGAREQVWPALEQQPLRPMALLRAAAPAQRVGAVPVVVEAVKLWSHTGQ